MTEEKVYLIESSTLEVKCMQMRIWDLEVCLDSIKLLVKTL